MEVRLGTAGGLLSFTPSEDDGGAIRIDAGLQAEEPINRLLLGKFTEHLGRNIYNGMSAQILQNPSFADWSFYRGLKAGAARLSDQGFPVDAMLAAYEKGTAPYWVPVGDAQCLVDWESPVHGHTCQRVETSASGGIAQATWMPAHRTRDYVLSAYVRGSASKLRVSLRKAGVSGELCGADLAGVAGGDGGDWQQRRVDLSLPDGALATGEIVELWVMAKGGGRFWLDLVFLLPADHLDGCDPDVIRYLKESKLPLYRFPGGNFVSGYHWRDGVGPLAERPLLMNPAWDCPEPNFIGTDEHLAFCQAVVCEPMICVNAGNGSPREAAQWVEYCNGTSDTEMGKLRADNGHPEPYGVRYWEVGNELYGGWQIGSCTPEEYAERYEAFQNAMLEVDESILLIGNGQNLNWNEPILKRKGTLVRSLSTHRLVGGGARDEEDADAVFDALMASTTGYDADISALAEQAAGFGWDVKTAVTELQVFTNRPHLPNNNSMAEALFLGGTIHSALRLGDVVEMITHSALVNHGGGLRKQKEIVYPNPVHWVSHMYGNLEPARLVKTEWSCSTFDASIDAIGTYEGAPVLDVASAVSEDSAWLYVMVMNRSRTESVTTTIDLEGFDAGPKGRVETVVGRSFLDANTWDDPALVGIESETVDVVEGKMRVTLRPHSVNIVKVEGRGRNSGN